MPLTADDLDIKHEVLNLNDVVDKKESKKLKGRTSEIDSPLHSNGLIQSHKPSTFCNANNQKVLPAHSADTDALGDNCSDDIISQLLPIVKDAMQEFLCGVGNRACEVEKVISCLKLSDITPQYKQMLNSLNNAELCRLFEKLNIFHTSYEGSRMIFQTVDEQLRFSNSDMTLSSSISSLSNADNSGQLLTLMKSTSGISAAQTKPLSAITNDFTNRSPQRHLSGTEKVDSEFDNVIKSQQKVVGGMMTHERSSADELFVQQIDDIFYDQNTELMDRKILLQDSKFHLERRFIEQRLKNVEKRYEQRLSNVSLMLRKAYKEILDLRLGKAKALANKRMGQAELALKHAKVIHNSIQDEAVKSDIKQMVKQWEQILRDYKAWHANLDGIVDGQKAQVDSNYRFDELALLSPPDNIPCAPQLPPYAFKYFQQLEFECSDPSSELLRVIGPPVGFEMQTVAGSRFGAIGQPAPPAQRKIFTEAQINKLIEKTLEHFQDTHGSILNLSTEEVRNVLNELERRPLLLASDVTFSSVLSHVIKRVMEVTGAGGGKSSSQLDATC